MRDSDTGRSKGFGFVDFGVPDAAEKAVASMHDQECVDPALTFTSLAQSRIAPVSTQFDYYWLN
jgi:RNA recognition motif-containing protein